MRTPTIAVSSSSSQLESLLFSSRDSGLDSYLEQVGKREVCQNPYTPTLKAVNHANKTVLYFRPRCKQWSCPYCAEVNSSYWTWVATHGSKTLYNEQQALSFVTLTSHEALSQEAALNVLPSAWDKLRRRLNHIQPSMPYFMVPEPHKSGKVHAHAIVSCDLPKRWWKDNARSCGFGYQNDAQEVVSVGGVSSYVNKYLTKTLQNSNFGKNFRRVRKSQNWPKLPEKLLPNNWKVYPLARDYALSADIEQMQKHGYNTALVDYKTAWKVIGMTEGE